MKGCTRLKTWLTGILSLVALASLATSHPAAASSAAASSDPPAAIKDSPQYKRGRLLYIQCRACHELEAGGPRKIGPHLAGILGRSSAAVNDFAYSAALDSAGLIWDAETLDRFLRRPSDVVPGNTMAFAGIANPADRAALITFLTVESTKAVGTP